MKVESFTIWTNLT